MADSGATHSLITRSTLARFPHPPAQKTFKPIAVLGDASTAIAVHGSVLLCIYINSIPIYTSVFIVDSLGADIILGMNWCHNNNVLLRVPQQQLLIRHPRYGATTVPFLDIVYVPIRLAQSIQLALHHEHIVSLYAPVPSALPVFCTLDSLLCMEKQLVISDVVLKINRFHTYMLIHNSANTPCTLRAHTIIGLEKPSVNQIQIHPWYHNRDIVNYCRENDIAVMGYSPLAKAKKIDDETVIEIAKKLSKTPAQVLIRWSVQHGFITIPKTSQESRLISNADVFNWSIPDSDMKILDSLGDLHWSCTWDPTKNTLKEAGLQQVLSE
ncbi:unnamed protein product [Rotaria sordida]|uniref:NADP-dependent oxidoreductase domain-containing protein n=1 Tax=Rotaria sordida TaxID=392033 RepID=A0A814H1W4_9BILA|nr:unnamed protein product [Rotaria sordida]